MVANQQGGQDQGREDAGDQRGERRPVGGGDPIDAAGSPRAQAIGGAADRQVNGTARDRESCHTVTR